MKYLNISYRLSRRSAAILMLAVYLLISVSPLAASAMQYKQIAHAVTKQCAGDCSICGCSLESRAAKTCCCARKHAREESLRHLDDDSDEPECCKKARGEETQKPAVVISCGCPCSNSKQIAVLGADSSETIPFSFFHQAVRPLGETTFVVLSYLPDSRHIAPPDQPPEVSIS